MNFFIFHGIYGHPEENWFPWPKMEIEKLGYACIVPKFPTPLDQSLESWLRVISFYITVNFKKLFTIKNIFIYKKLNNSF